MKLPLKLFDRYVLNLFIRQLLFALLAATVIFIVVDLVEHLDKFIDRKVPFIIVFEYYAYFLPNIIYLVLPVAALLSALFTVGGLSRTNEITAMKASGIGLHRIQLHLLVLGLLLSTGNFFFGETIVPYSNKIDQQIYRYYVKGESPEQVSSSGVTYLRNRPGELVRIKHFDQTRGQIYDLDWQQFNQEVMVRRVTAPKALWLDSTWVLESGRKYFYSPDSIRQVRFVREPFANLGFKPSDLAKVQTDPKDMGYWQLLDFVQKVRDMGGDPHKWEVELAFKQAMPWTCAIVILLGVPIAARYRRSGVSLAFGIGLLISFLFFAMQQTGRIMGYSGSLEPFIAAWTANLTFTVVGMLLYWRVPK
ncbi:MAG: LptF/LptG family permease [bacterium]|nr:LptF/LptG family permease [bacterium]